MGLRCTDLNFSSGNEHAALDGVVYFFSFEFAKLLTLFKEHLKNCFVVNMYKQRIKFFS